MGKSNTGRMLDRLRSFQGSTPDVEASAIVDVDGLTIASSLPLGYEEDLVSAMSAAMLSIGERISDELGRGLLNEVYVQGNGGYVLLMPMGKEALLSVLARQEARLGLVLLEMRKATDDLGELVRT